MKGLLPEGCKYVFHLPPPPCLAQLVVIVVHTVDLVYYHNHEQSLLFFFSSEGKTTIIIIENNFSIASTTIQLQHAMWSEFFFPQCRQTLGKSRMTFSWFGQKHPSPLAPSKLNKNLSNH